MHDEKGPDAVEEFDVIVCGAGSGGSTAAGLLAADEDLRETPWLRAWWSVTGRLL